jgi:hypothetical protein
MHGKAACLCLLELCLFAEIAVISSIFLQPLHAIGTIIGLAKEATREITIQEVTETIAIESMAAVAITIMGAIETFTAITLSMGVTTGTFKRGHEEAEMNNPIGLVVMIEMITQETYTICQKGSGVITISHQRGKRLEKTFMS